MDRAGRQIQRAVAVLPFLVCAVCLQAQKPDSPLDTSGKILIDGHSTPYFIRHLPVSSFPQLPPAIQEILTHRGCLIPQTYEAHRPENVIHASLERAGTSDWAVLCSVKGTASLLVFFAGSSADPVTLASAPETSRLQTRSSSGTLGFNWAIDPATPKDVHQAQLGMRHRPPRLDHDALADSAIEGKTVYRYYSHGAWTTLDTED